MKIYTLGTSHGDSTVCRFNSSTAYETEDGRIYLVDAGAPVEALLRRKALHIKDVRAVFISHMHDDHAGGLSGLIKQATKYASTRNTPFTTLEMGRWSGNSGQKALCFITGMAPLRPRQME